MDFLLGGLAAMGAGVFTNPLEVVKTRMQLQGELRARGTHQIHYRNVMHAFYAVASTDGILALQNGLVASLWFQLIINGVRLGIFQTAENNRLLCDSNGNLSVLNSGIAGAVGGAAGAALGSPFSLIKTQFQSRSGSSISVGHQHHHTNLRRAFVGIYQKEGVKGLYRGAPIQIPRAGVGSGIQLAMYNLCKNWFITHEVFDKSSTLVSFFSSTICGTVTAITMTPFDVISTRLYNQGVDSKGSGLIYKGIVDCIQQIWMKERYHGFYKGFWPAYLRIGPHTVLTFVFWDKLKLFYQQYLTETK